MKKLNLMVVALVVLALSVNGWGACSYSSTGYTVYPNNTNNYCKGDPRVDRPIPLCSTTPACNGGVFDVSSYYYTDCHTNYNGRNTCSYVEWSTSTYNNIKCTRQCSTKAEADSISCFLQGNIWQGGTCKINHCNAADSTWLSTSIAACTGSNNYALVNTDSTCEHVGTCCPNDSIPSGNTCKWRCDSVLTQCNGRDGALFGAVLPDTSVSDQDTTFSYQCFYNCAHSPNPDSTVYIVEGNTVLAGPSDSIADGIKSEWFSSIRSTTGSIYVYDYLSPSASEYVDSIAAMKCVEHLWRCVINNKYVYWYDNQEVPAGCTNIVRVK